MYKKMKLVINSEENEMGDFKGSIRYLKEKCIQKKWLIENRKITIIQI
jgi:hypothetical protein